MGIKITNNRVHVSNKITKEDIHVMEKIVDLRYIQIGNYIDHESLNLIDEFILKRNQDIQFRIFRFDDAICNLEFLKYVKHLKNLLIDTLETVEGLEYLSELEEIDSLTINVFNLNDIEFLNNISLSLKKLAIGTEMNKNQINISVLKRFTNLESLFLYKIKDDLEKLNELKNLQKLILNSINLPNLTFMSKTNITDLSIGYITECSLDVLKGNNNLNTLELSKITKLKNLDIITELKNLLYLKVSQLNNIEYIPNLINNKRLEHIILDDMKKLKDISALEFAPNLKYIEMYQMKSLEVDDIKSVINNKSIIKAKCFTGVAKKDKVIRELIQELNLE